MPDPDILAVIELIKQHPVAAVATAAGNQPWNRPMVTARVGDDLTLHFATFEWSNKVKQVEANAEVCVAYFGGRKDARVFGTAEFLRDQQTKDELWHPSWAQYFPGEQADPAYIVMKVTPRKVEYRELDRDGLSYRRVL